MKKSGVKYFLNRKEIFIVFYKSRWILCKISLLEMNFLILRDEWSLNLPPKLMKAGVARPLAELEGGDKM